MNTPEPSKADQAGASLDALLQAAQKKGHKVAELGRNLTKAGQELSDVATATRSLVHVVKTPRNVEWLIGDWQNVNTQADDLLAQTETILVPQFSSASGTAAVSSSDAANDPVLFEIVPQDQHPQLIASIRDINNVLSRSADTQEVSDMMRQLGLDKAPLSRKSALELFQTAHSAYEAPVSSGDPASTSLIPLREAIRESIEYLLKRRPRQERASREWDKVQSVGNQLKRGGIPKTQVDSWAFQWTSQLQYALSPAKQEAISREEWRTRLVRGTLFLRGFLGGIDPANLR